MTQGLWKNIIRTIRHSLGRYIAILLIVLLGVAFLAGLRLTHPVMTQTLQDYVNAENLYDFRLMTTLGIDEEDVAAISDVASVNHAEGAVQVDFLTTRGDSQLVYQAGELTQDINQTVLLSGRMPASADECAGSSTTFTEEDLGRTITVDASNDEDTLNSLTCDSYTMVGIVYSPLDISIVKSTTSLGNGVLEGTIYLTSDGFSADYDTVMYVDIAADSTVYSDAYDDDLDAMKDKIEAALTASVQKRYDGYVSEAEEKILDAEKKLAKAKEEGEEKLAEAKAKLDDAKDQIDEGADTLASSKTKLDAARKALDAAARKIDADAPSWEDAYNIGMAAYKKGKSQLTASISEAQSELDAAKSTLEESETQYARGQTDLANAQSQYESGLQAYHDALKTYEDNLSTYNTRKSACDTALSQYEAAVSAGALSDEEAAAVKATLDATASQLAAFKAQLDEGKSALDTQKQVLDAAKAEIESGQAELNEARSTLDAGWAEWHANNDKLQSTKASGEKELQEAYDNLQAFKKGIDEYNDGMTRYNQGVLELEDAKEEYEQGLSSYKNGQETLDKEIAKAEKKILKGKEELEDLTDPEVYVLDRYTNIGYASFRNDAAIVDKLGLALPVFFFLIAALVVSTTMTRMIDEERIQMGVFKSLGYGEGAVIFKYLSYSASAAVIGSLAGYFAGGWLFPLTIFKAYRMMYSVPGYHQIYSLPLFVVTLGAALLSSAGVTWVTCARELRSQPAALIRPKAPDAGKRVLLERITPIWSRLSFLHKVTARNIFRFKKRMFMMILGIAGCMALLMTCFGLKDSIAGIADYQYDDIMTQDLYVSTKKTVTDEMAAKVEEACGDDADLIVPCVYTSTDFTANGTTKSVYIIATDDPSVSDMINLNEDGRTLAYPADGHILAVDNTGHLFGFETNGTYDMTFGTTHKTTLTVSGMTENYVYNFIYMNAATYTDVFGEDYAPQTFLIRLKDGADAHQTGASLANVTGVKAVSVIDDIRDMVNQMMVSLNYIITLVLGCAIALALIVMFNLGNINITERTREIATLKVIGFRRSETGAYVFRENFVLCLFGIVAGIPLGKLLHAFIMDQIKIDVVTFRTYIASLSMALSVMIVIVFALLTDRILRRKIARINMAESLKSVE